MAEVAARVLAAAAEEDKKYATIHIEKPIELELDLGNLLAVDNNQIENSRLLNRDERDDFLKDLARENTQLLINSIWSLPTERVEEVIVAKFPPPTYKLPREKPLPLPKVPTKWEKYAKEKGITKSKKKDRLIWDDIVKKWVPQFGYKKKQVENEKNWCIPIKEGPDPVLNPHEKMVEDKKEKSAKNELQRLRNLARAKNIKVPTVGVVTTDPKGTKKPIGFSDELKGAAQFVKNSTASLGKFQPDLNKKLEKQAKVKGKKRQFESNTTEHNKELERNLGILESLKNKQVKLDVNNAEVNRQVGQEKNERREEKHRPSKSKAKGKGGKRSTFSGKKKKGNKGK